MENNMKKEKYIIISDEQQVYTEEITEGDMQNLLESGWVSAILRVRDCNVEYADPDHETGIVTWKKPEIKTY